MRSGGARKTAGRRVLGVMDLSSGSRGRRLGSAVAATRLKGLLAAGDKVLGEALEGVDVIDAATTMRISWIMLPTPVLRTMALPADATGTSWWCR